MTIPRNRVTRTAAAIFIAAVCRGATPALAQGQVPAEPGIALDVVRSRQPLPFTALGSSAACVAGGLTDQLLVPPGFTASIVASEGEGFPDQPDMLTVNETGQAPGRFLYRTHETPSNSALSVTDLVTGVTRILAQRDDWERLDGIVWTPWGTLLVAEEALASRRKDPTQPNAVGGHVYEVNPQTGVIVVRPAIGARPHEGMRFDRQGNLYGISETAPGYIYKFVPSRRNDLSAGRLFALRLASDQGDRIGWAEWVALDSSAVLVNAVAEATAKGATAYSRPEDVEIGTSTGDDRRGNNVVYVSITGERRVLAIDLKPAGGRRGQVWVSNYVAAGLNAPDDFGFPDNLALDRGGNLYIAEDPPGNAARGKTRGDDVWFAPFNPASARQALPVQRFATITDCDAEPTGLYLSPTGKTLFVNIQHRGGSDPRDLTLRVQRPGDARSTNQGTRP